MSYKVNVFWIDLHGTCGGFSGKPQLTLWPTKYIEINGNAFYYPEKSSTSYPGPDQVCYNIIQDFLANQTDENYMKVVSNCTKAYPCGYRQKKPDWIKDDDN